MSSSQLIYKDRDGGTWVSAHNPGAISCPGLLIIDRRWSNVMGLVTSLGLIGSGSCTKQLIRVISSDLQEVSFAYSVCKGLSFSWRLSRIRRFQDSWHSFTASKGQHLVGREMGSGLSPHCPTQNFLVSGSLTTADAY